MFSGITVKKKIYASKTAQITVCLCIGKFKPVCESTNTCHYILDSIKYFFLIHRKCLFCH